MSAIPESPSQNTLIPAFLRDIRVLQVIGQIIFVIILVAVISSVASQIVSALTAKGIAPNLTFLQNTGGFDISERPAWHTSSSTFGQAFIVGLLNTLRVASVGLVLATILGVLLGIFLLSRNWLIRSICRAYVEILRNTPLLVQLFVWYFIIIFSLPDFLNSIAFPQEGVYFIALRLFIYIVILLITRFNLRSLPVDSPRRIMGFYAVITAIIFIEVLFALNPIYQTTSVTTADEQQTQTSQLVFGSSQTSALVQSETREDTLLIQSASRQLYAWGDVGSMPLIVYVLISGAAFAAIYYYVPLSGRAPFLGVAIGQLAGGLIYYFGIVPNAAFRTELYPAVYANIRGFTFLEVRPTARFAEWFAFAMLGIVLALIIWVYAGRITETTGRPIARGFYALLAVVGLAFIGWIFVTLEPTPSLLPFREDGETVYLSLDQARARNLVTLDDEVYYYNAPFYIVLPQRTRFAFITGVQITPEYMALLLGLVFYTSTFIGEIVRAGIQAVSYGQVEAARALGLSQAQVLRLVVLPQALRVIIPPLGNQYLNLTKNSSLAIAVAYADLYLVSQTIMNTSGQSISGMFIMMITYLVMSLTIAFVMSIVNQRFQLVTR